MALKPWLERMPLIVSLVVFCIGCLTLLGWYFDIALLKAGFWNDAVTVKVNTAFCFVLASGTLTLIAQSAAQSSHQPDANLHSNQPSASKPIRLAIFSGASSILLIGLLTLMEYGAGWNLGIDELVFSDPANFATFYPGRMGINTAVKFILLGTSLLLFDQRRQIYIKIAQMLTVVMAAMALQTVVSYSYGVRVFYPSSSYATSIALPTALTFLVLCAGMLFLYPQQGLIQALTAQLDGSMIAKRLLPTTIVLPVLGGCLVWGYRAGYYVPEVGFSIFVVSLVAVQTFMIGQSAVWLNRNDAKRRRLEATWQQTADDSFFHLSLDLLCVAGMDGYFKRLNPAFERVLGYSETELLAQPLIEFVHPEDRISTLAALDQLSQGNPVIHFENRYRCQDGSYRWLDWVTKPVTEAGLLYAVAHDVTSRKQLEAELRINEKRFSCLYNANIIGIVEANFAGEIIEANDAFLQMVGYSRADLQNQEISWLGMTPPEYLPLDQKSIDQVRQTGSGPIYEKEYIRKDGSRVAVLLGAALLPDAPEKAICFILDLTDRKQTESALRESEARFRHMTDAAPMLVWMSGLDRQCNYFNQAGSIYGAHSERRSWGMAGQKAFIPMMFSAALKTYTAAFDDRQPFEMEYQLRRADGSYRWMLDMGVPRFTPMGDFLGYIGSCFDIHDRKQAEADTRRINEILELRVKERTVQLEVSNKELESFSYSVSHDLRAPLRHIAGFVELLQKHLDPAALDATSQRYLAIIAETTKQAGTLIDDLLAFSSMGRSEMRSMQVNLQKIVHEIQQELEPEIAQRQIHWQIDPLPTVQGDPAMLRLVVRNLVENAVKYTRLRAEAEIHIGSISSTQEDVLFVRDNGIGFNMQYAHKLFGIFQRLHSDPNYEGTGIGLANVQRIIHRHGGRTWAESTLNQGATFFFSLPKTAD